MNPELTLRGLGRILTSAGFGPGIKKKFERYQRVTTAWLRLEFAVDSLDQGEAERALRDLMFALGASTCDETENGDGSATLTFCGLGRIQGRSLRIKVEVVHG